MTREELVGGEEKGWLEMRWEELVGDEEGGACWR